MDSSKKLLSATAWLRPRFLPGLSGLAAHKLVQYWSRTPADRPTFSPRRLLVSLPHHGEWWEPARAVRRGAAHGSGGRDAFSASRSEGQTHSGRGKEDPHPIPLLRLLVEGGLLLLLLLLFLTRCLQKKFRGQNFKNMNVTHPTPFSTSRSEGQTS